MSIIEIHNKIYVDAAVTTVMKPMDNILARHEDLYSREITRLKNILVGVGLEQVDSSVLNPFLLNLKAFIENLQHNNLLTVFDFDKFPPPDDAYLADPIITPWRTTPASTAMDINVGKSIADPRLPFRGERTPQQSVDEYYIKNIRSQDPNPSFEEYFVNRDRWNITDGRAMLIELTKKEVEEVGKSVTTQKTKKVLELVISFGLDQGLDQVYEIFHFEPPKIFSKLASLVLESKFKDCIVRASVKLLGAIRNKVAGSTISVTACSVESDQAAETQKQDLATEDDKFIASENEALLGRKHNWEKKKGEIRQMQIAQEEKAKEDAKKAEALEKLAENKAEEDAKIAEVAALTAQRNARRLHSNNAVLEQKIKDGIDGLDLGVPTDMADRVSRFLKRNNTGFYGIAGMQNIRRNKAYDPYTTLENNVQMVLNDEIKASNERIKNDLKNYMVPAIPGVSNADYVQQLRNNYRLVSQSRSVRSVVESVVSRDNLKGTLFDAAFGNICSCCHLPLTFPVCLCRL